MMNSPKSLGNKVYSLMGFASRSKNLVTGYNTCLKLMGQRKIKLLIVAGDVGEGSKKKMKDKCLSHGIPYREYGTCSELSHFTGKEDKGLFGITEEGFASSIAKEIDKESKGKEVR